MHNAPLYHGRLILNVLDYIKIDTDLFVYVQFIFSFYRKNICLCMYIISIYSLILSFIKKMAACLFI